ncbi:MAG: Translation elongation factor P [uncultured Campylobacterales bacterium]|uniref:Elongation factor P n=1 Tax=uncultured Campylobacterales bacterium TaxID=352960 RepID=A0A6S6SVM8_9BACT|nr:MAG: Translation elongation factor P [uncultured Campylobacterales bacterium]
MALSMSDLKKGLKIEMNGVPYRVVEYQHVKPGKGPAFVRTKIKSFLNGKVIDKTFKPGDKFELPDLKEIKMQFLYDDGEMMQFMNTDTYDQIGLTYDQVGDNEKWFIDGMMCSILFYNDKPIGVDIDTKIKYTVTETPPNFKGDSQGGKKPATIANGAVIQVPFHIVEGDVIFVDTQNCEYLEKAK